MRMTIVMVLTALGYLLRFGGSLVIVGVFFYGIYALFAKSIAIGLMMIGAAVVGGWIIQIVSGLLLASAVGAAVVGAKENDMPKNKTTIGASVANAKDFFGKLANGDFGLAKTYWLYGVLVVVVVSIITSLSDIRSAAFETVFLLGVLVYAILVNMGVWRAANKYQGPKVWANLAKFFVFIAAVRLTITVMFLVAAAVREVAA